MGIPSRFFTTNPGERALPQGNPQETPPFGVRLEMIARYDRHSATLLKRHNRYLIASTLMLEFGVDVIGLL